MEHLADVPLDEVRHRVAITYEAEAEEKTSETVVQKIFDELPCRKIRRVWLNETDCDI